MQGAGIFFRRDSRLSPPLLVRGVFVLILPTTEPHRSSTCAGRPPKTGQNTDLAASMGILSVRIPERCKALSFLVFFYTFFWDYTQVLWSRSSGIPDIGPIVLLRHGRSSLHLGIFSTASDMSTTRVPTLVPSHADQISYTFNSLFGYLITSLSYIMLSRRPQDPQSFVSNVDAFLLL